MFIDCLENTKTVVDKTTEKPLYSSNIASKLIHGDIIEVLRSFDNAQKYDVIIADPPYNIGKDFGNNSDYMEINDYIIWVKQWVKLCLDRLKSNGLMYIYGFPEILARIAAQYPLENQRILAWHYTNKTTPSSKFWQRSYESILCLWKNARPHLAIDQIREPYTDNYLKCSGKKRKETLGRFSNGAMITTYQVHEKGALPRDVIKVPALAGGAGKNQRWFLCKNCNDEIYHPSELHKHKGHNILQHPTQKPFLLTKKLIQSCIVGSRGNILIPFAGSGSECIVAKKLNIEFDAIELNPDYVDFAQKWLKKIDEVQELCID